MGVEEKRKTRSMYSVHISQDSRFVEPRSLASLKTASEDEEGFEESGRVPVGFGMSNSVRVQSCIEAQDVPEESSLWLKPLI